MVVAGILLDVLISKLNCGIRLSIVHDAGPFYQQLSSLHSLVYNISNLSLDI